MQFQLNIEMLEQRLQLVLLNVFFFLLLNMLLVSLLLPKTFGNKAMDKQFI